MGLRGSARTFGVGGRRLMPGLPIVPLSSLGCCAVSAARARLCISFQALSQSDCQVLSGGLPSTNWCLARGGALQS